MERGWGQAAKAGLFSDADWRGNYFSSLKGFSGSGVVVPGLCFASGEFGGGEFVGRVFGEVGSGVKLGRRSLGRNLGCGSCFFGETFAERGVPFPDFAISSSRCFETSSN